MTTSKRSPEAGVGFGGRMRARRQCQHDGDGECDRARFHRESQSGRRDKRERDAVAIEIGDACFLLEAVMPATATRRCRARDRRGARRARYVAPSARAASATALNRRSPTSSASTPGASTATCSRMPCAVPGDRTEERESGDRSVARDDERLVLRVVPALREREDLDGPVDVRRDAERPHEQVASALRVLGLQRARSEREVAGHSLRSATRDRASQAPLPSSPRKGWGARAP